MRAITNTSKNPIYVGNRMILPGDTQLFEGLPAAPAEAAVVERDAIAQLLEHEVDGVLKPRSVKDIGAQLPELDDATLAGLAERESAVDKPRKSLLEAITAEQLGRANKKLEAA